MASTVWPVSRIFCSYTHSAPRAPPFVKVGHVPPVPYGVGASAGLKILDLPLMEPTLGVDIKAISKLIWYKNCNGRPTVVKCLFHIFTT